MRNQRKLAYQKSAEKSFQLEKAKIEEKIESLNDKLNQIAFTRSRKRTEIIEKERKIENLQSEENLQIIENDEENKRFREAVKEKSCWRMKIEKQKSDIEKAQSQIQSLKKKITGERESSILDMKGPQKKTNKLYILISSF